VFACAFVIPLLQLLVWFWQRGGMTWTSVTRAGAAHPVPGWHGGADHRLRRLLLAFARRWRSTGIRAGVGLANLGYALPGSVLAVSIMLAFSYLDNQLVIPLSSWLGGAGKPLLLGSSRRCCWPTWCASSPWPTGRWKAAWSASARRCRSGT
jgi:iron(III) transport system permease protein